MNDTEKKISEWLSGPYDEETKAEIKRLEKENPIELKEAFYTDLDFGTGGLRGIMGIGPNRMNKYTVGAATQGLANYLTAFFKNEAISVAIAYDCRNQSDYFAAVAADVLSANGIRVFLFDELRPTPELSFAVRKLKCNAGIVITASHNPKEYNGYKVYWNDGGQLVPPHDKKVISEVRAVSDPEKVKFIRNKELVTLIGAEFDELYLKALMNVCLTPNAVSKHSDLGIVYTPLHGTGVKLVPEALHRFGFKNIISVPEQDINDGNFPTVASPNPEEKNALKMAIAKAEATNATIILATDPDADRVGVGVRSENGEYVLLNGNQTAAILVYYTLTRLTETGRMPQNPMMVKTIVTTDLLSDIASDFGVKMYEVLTGFKYIAEIIRLHEGKETFIGGGEESYGYLGADFVRDKDAVMTSCMIAEAAAWAASKSTTLLGLLDEIYSKYGFYTEHLISLTKKGIAGQQEIVAMMEGFRSNPPLEIDNIKVMYICDLKSSDIWNLDKNSKQKTDLPSSDVLQFILEDGSKITVRPSGTEPKIKFYFSIRCKSYSKQSQSEAKDRMNRLSIFFSEN
ncbi:MAG: phosphoglucomutase [Bacteroidetes bacterium HGW-Bacteroidetes-6]|jgi:phosphoglucomutase|nr:MAG: phosphoglucomutase [Bacteroidetes bacterium HGW-Bacteroidetes-6]